ncbi:MAG: DUF4012 domain-containing protein [Patescibacteria group bacterium]|jgi:hypothetical protein
MLVRPKKNKKTIAKTALRKKPLNKKPVVIEVTQTDYLSHDFSPHLLNLKTAPSRRRLEVNWPAEEPVVNYFNAISERSFAVSPEEAEQQKQAKIQALKQEIAAIENVALAIDIWQELDEEPTDSLAGLDPIEIIRPAAIEPETDQTELLIMSGGIAHRVVVYLDEGVNQLVQPFRNLPLTRPQKALIGFAVVALCLILPIGGLGYYRSLSGQKSGILSSASAAAGDLSAAGQAVGTEDYSAATEEFDAAYQKFSAARDELQKINKLVTAVAKLLPETDKALTTANSLLAIGQNLATVGKNLTSGLANWNDNTPLGEKVFQLKTSLVASAPLIEGINEEIKKADWQLLPADKQFQFIELQQKMPVLLSSFRHFIELSDFAEKMLGRHELKRYLVVFQNNHEIRPTGGFIGSFALIDLVDGQIKNLEVPAGGSYDLQGSLKAKVAAPQPLQLINERWEFQDSNWFSDWPTAARKIIWFYNQAGGPTVDGVVAVNSDLLADLLKIIGPVSADGRQVNADNFYQVTQKAVEKEYTDAARPKEFIGQLAPKVLDSALGSGKTKLLDVMTLVGQALDSKDLQLYLTAPEAEAELAKLGWQNEIKAATSDYLLVVNANIGGQKSDAVIGQKILHQAKIDAAGRVTDKVTIIRTHRGVPEEEFYGARNVNYLRVYAPAGSRLISASGVDAPSADLFKDPGGDLQQDQDLLKVSGITKTDAKTGVKINEEFGKTVFGLWTQVYPGKTAVVSLEYELPFRVAFAKFDTRLTWLNWLEEKLQLTDPTAEYSLLLQKQSGVASEFYSLVNYPADWQKVWQYPAGLRVGEGTLGYSSYLDQDRVYGVMFKK